MRHLAERAPAPTTLEETGLSMTFLGDLTIKHLLEGGDLSLVQLAARIALAGKILEEVLHFLRQEAQVEVLAGLDRSESLRYALTERGRRSAFDAMARNGYVGAAPVPLREYTRVVRAQTVHGANVTREQMHAAFAGVVLKEGLLDQLGPSLNSGRAIFIYGPAGTGKTYITQRLARLFRDEVLIPHAIAINETNISVFDPVLHRPIVHDERPELVFSNRFDARWVPCERPILVSGGELTADMLEVQLEPLTREYRAPLQLKANSGLFIIDDMGRQRVAPETIFNRWIVPMEEKVDYLSLGSGRHFSVPFDLVLVFSTNMNPTDLADEAFLRRIGYKIRFDTLDRDAYQSIWREECRIRGAVCSDAVFDYVVRELHQATGTPMLPCHPRDLLSIAVDHLHYLGKPLTFSPEHLAWAWQNYFVDLGNETTRIPTPITELPRRPLT
jgi:predicted ATPase with chaperone activity